MFGRNDTREIPDLEGLPGGQRPGAWPGPPATCGTTSRGSSMGSSCGGGLSPTGLSILNFGEAAGGPVKGAARRDHYPYNQFGSDVQARLPRTDLYAVSPLGLGTTESTLVTNDPYKNGLAQGRKSVAEREAETGLDKIKHQPNNPIPRGLAQNINEASQE